MSLDYGEQNRPINFSWKCGYTVNFNLSSLHSIFNKEKR